ncbi:MAG: hypothetical protein V9E83_10230 [Baekduia sp.]
MPGELDDMIRRYGNELGRAQRRQRTRSLPVKRVAVASAAAGLALGIAVAVLPGGGPTDARADVVAQARKALNPGQEIVHYRVSATTNAITGPSKPVVSEYWAASDPPRWRDLTQGSERWRVGDYLYQYDARRKLKYRSYIGDEVLAKMSDYGDPVKKVTGLLASGVLRSAGTVEVRGRRAVRFIGSEVADAAPLGGFKKRPKIQLTYDYRVDPENYEPIQFIDGFGAKGQPSQIASTVDFQLFERLKLTPENETLLKVEVPADAKVVNVGPTKKQAQATKQR